MKYRPKPYMKFNLYLNVCSNVNLRSEKPPKMEKIDHISVWAITQPFYANFKKKDILMLSFALQIVK